MKRFVYKTTNLLTGKIYIGQHSTKNIDDGYLGSGVYLKKAFKKYGKENFKCEIIAYVDGSKEDLDHAEEFFIKHHKNTVGWDMMYNTTERARGVDCHTEETRKKMSEAKKGVKLSEEIRKKMSEAKKGVKLSEETRKKMSESLKGRQFSEETRKKMSESLKGNQNAKGNQSRKGCHLSEETRKKMSEAKKGVKLSEEHKQKLSAALSKKILCVEMNVIYPSVSEASRQTGISQPNISSVCIGRTKTAGGYHWKYI